MLHYRSRLYADQSHHEPLYMGSVTPLDLMEDDGADDSVMFYRDVNTVIGAGLDLSNATGSVFPPPLLKTVETLAHPEYPMGVTVELLYYGIRPGVWVPYYAKLFLGGRLPLPVLFRHAIDDIHTTMLGWDAGKVVSTLSQSLWTCCGMTGKEYAQEGISYFEHNVPYAQSILKVWPSVPQMVGRINRAVDQLSRNRDYLNTTIIDGITSDLYVPLSDIPIILRSSRPIHNRFVEYDRISRSNFYMTDPSPVRIDTVEPTDAYSPRYRDVFYAIDMFPLTDFELSVLFLRSGEIYDMSIPWAIDRNIVLSDETSITGLLEGHVRAICEKLGDCIAGGRTAFQYPSMSLHDIYGTNSIRITISKSHDELIQIRIYDRPNSLVFAMTMQSALIKLTDISVMCPWSGGM